MLRVIRPRELLGKNAETVLLAIDIDRRLAAILVGIAGGHAHIFNCRAALAAGDHGVGDAPALVVALFLFRAREHVANLPPVLAHGVGRPVAIFGEDFLGMSFRGGCCHYGNNCEGPEKKTG